MRAGQLTRVQDLRGIAAMLVVVYHAARGRDGFHPVLGQVDLGAVGVAVFFVISGFVMGHACRDEPPLTFLRRRVIRIVPLYWLLTAVWFAILLRADIAQGLPFRRVGELLQSLFFLPHWNANSPDRIWPILVPGWTLNFEMFFFAVFLVGLRLGPARQATALLLVALVAAGALLQPQDPRLITWTHPYLLLFVAGLGLSIAWDRGIPARMAWALPAGAAVLLAAALPEIRGVLAEAALFAGAIATMAGALALQVARPALSLPLLRQLGDASYSIYLSHTITLMVWRRAAAPVFGGPLSAAGIVAAVLACTVVGLAVDRLIERPMSRRLRRPAPIPTT